MTKKKKHLISISIITIILTITMIIVIINNLFFKGLIYKNLTKSNNSEKESYEVEEQIEDKEENKEQEYIEEEDKEEGSLIAGSGQEYQELEDKESIEKNLLSIKTEIEKINFPYEIKDKDIVIEKIAQYTGPFIEDGSDIAKGNVISMVIKNTSDEMLQYTEIYLNINKDKKITFKASTIPPQSSVIVLEQSGNVEFNDSDEFFYEDSICTRLKDVSLMEDKIEIKMENKKLGVKNISNEKLATVYVYYKYKNNEYGYLGGITYRNKFENISPGEYLELDAKHFLKDISEIIMVDYIN